MDTVSYNNPVTKTK